METQWGISFEFTYINKKRKRGQKFYCIQKYEYYFSQG